MEGKRNLYASSGFDAEYISDQAEYVLRALPGGLFIIGTHS